MNLAENSFRKEEFQIKYKGCYVGLSLAIFTGLILSAIAIIKPKKSRGFFGIGCLTIATSSIGIVNFAGYESIYVDNLAFTTCIGFLIMAASASSMLENEFPAFKTIYYAGSTLAIETAMIYLLNTNEDNKEAKDMQEMVHVNLVLNYVVAGLLLFYIASALKENKTRARKFCLFQSGVAASLYSLNYFIFMFYREMNTTQRNLISYATLSINIILPVSAALFYNELNRFENRPAIYNKENEPALLPK